MLEFRIDNISMEFVIVPPLNEIEVYFERHNIP